MHNAKNGCLHEPPQLRSLTVPTVFLDSPTNSTMFTTCCEVAINDGQEHCPQCHLEITPHSAAGRWEAAYGPIRSGRRGYGNHQPPAKIKLYDKHGNVIGG